MVGHSKENTRWIMCIIGIPPSETTCDSKFPSNILINEIESFLFVTNPLCRSPKKPQFTLEFAAIIFVAVVDLTLCSGPDFYYRQIINGHTLHGHSSKSQGLRVRPSLKIDKIIKVMEQLQ